MFLMAYTSGTYLCVMDINRVGEANIELVMWIIVLPVLIYGTLLLCQDVLNIFDERLKILKGD
jgi:hypothetical protein